MQSTFNKYLNTTILFAFIALSAGAQRPGGLSQPDGQRPGQDPEEESKGEIIPPDVRNWLLRDMFTFSDTVPVDTISNGYQIFNPIYRKSIANVHLGNMGLAYQSMIFDEQESHYGFRFYNTLLTYLDTPEDMYWYNTKTPYVNVTYHFGGPKRTAEESISALYTQNINKKWNVGLRYQLGSSTGQYQAQRAKNQKFKLFSSYNGERYNLHTAFWFTRVENRENHGTNLPDGRNFTDEEQTQDVPVKILSAKNQFNNFDFFLNQSLFLGNINVKGLDSTMTKLPLSTVYHTMDVHTTKRQFKIGNSENDEILDAFYGQTYLDPDQTVDSTQYTNINNTFQIKFNEEANTIFKFGLRAFITNEVHSYKYQQDPRLTTEEINADNYTPKYKTKDTTLVNTAFGGQIFKNLGENFWWKAGVKFYFQGKRAGDTELTGSLNSSFRIGKDTAGFFANGGLYLQTPDFLTNQYFSNHVKWDGNFKETQSIRFKGGIRIPTRRLELSATGNVLTDHIYWNSNGIPEQASDAIHIYNARLKKHFILARRIHSVFDAVVQHSSDEDKVPLPTLALYNSTYYENTLFNVLHFQIGADVRYHSKYYIPAYNPAVAAFVNQNVKQVGDYPFVDAFVNFQLKRARFFIKFDHVNQGLLSDPYYHAYQYPGNPRSFKYGISWNFYD